MLNGLQAFLVVLFLVQQFGTTRISFMFSPGMTCRPCRNQSCVDTRQLRFYGSSPWQAREFTTSPSIPVFSGPLIPHGPFFVSALRRLLISSVVDRFQYLFARGITIF